jgi:hypothetical protein
VDTGTGFLKSQSSAADARPTVFVPFCNSVGSVQAYTEKDESLTVWVWESHPRHLLIRGSGAKNDGKSYALDFVEPKAQCVYCVGLIFVSA